MVNSLSKSLIYPALDCAFQVWGRYQLQQYDIHNTILVASSGRGGSTWLTNIISTLPGYPTLWEPLHPVKNPDCRNHGFNYNSYFPLDAATDQQYQYLDALFRGKMLSTRITSALAFHPQKYVSFHGFLVKLVNANLLLPWLLHHFPLRTIFMLRHPCAVVSSQLRHTAWKHVTKDICYLPETVREAYPQLENLFESIQTQEEVLAFEWVLKTYIPLRKTRPHPWYLALYENLVAHGEKELEKIFNFLGEPIPPQAYRFLSQPSTTSQKNSNVVLGYNQLTGWKQHLTTQQIHRILDITHRAGLDFYSDALMPDETRLDQLE